MFTTACLGFISSLVFFQGAIPRLNAYYGPATVPIWLDNLRCTGKESNILSCTHNEFGVLSSYCDHGDDSGIECPGKWLSKFR